MNRNNICSTLARYRGLYGTLWSFGRAKAVITIRAPPSTVSGLVSSTFHRFRAFIQFALGRTPHDLRKAITNSSFQTIRQVSQTTVRSPFISRLVTGRRVGLNEGYFRNSSRFQAINRRYLLNTGFSFALVGIYARDENGFPNIFRETNPQEKRSTWQNAFKIVKNHYFQLNEIREDIDSVEKIKFNDPIAKGCNGVVYTGEIASKQQDGKTEQVAVKMLFNYDVESNSEMILKSFVNETIPFAGKFSDIQVKRKCLPPHQNIVKILSVFAGNFQLLKGGVKDYPRALPMKFGGYGRNMTLFIVERLYDMSLTEYLRLVGTPSKKTSLGMLTQLFDGIEFLHEHHVAHRDLKPDNILVKCNDFDSLPWLVITDFGLASTTLQLEYSNDQISRGGNIALMAPEIINKQPGYRQVLDYSRSDLWAIGTIAYELFGADNPFYRRTKHSFKISSATYNESSLPPFPSNCHLLNTLVRRILSVDPDERPSPSFCSLFCHLLLHMGAKNYRHLIRVKNDKIRESLTKSWWEMFIKDLISQKWNSAKKLNTHEHQLRINFASKATVRQLQTHITECIAYE